MSYIDRVNYQQISADDLRATQLALESEPTGGRSFEATIVTLAQLFPGQPLKVQAIVFRMQALGRLIETSRPGWWFLPERGDGAAMVSDLALRVAAEVPLIESGNEVAFDEAQFLSRALELSEGAGEA